MVAMVCSGRSRPWWPASRARPPATAVPRPDCVRSPSPGLTVATGAKTTAHHASDLPPACRLGKLTSPHGTTAGDARFPFVLGPRRIRRVGRGPVASPPGSSDPGSQSHGLRRYPATRPWRWRPRRIMKDSPRREATSRYPSPRGHRHHAHHRPRQRQAPPVAIPWNPASPKVKMPPSEATSQYPPAVRRGGHPTTGWFSGCRSAVEGGVPKAKMPPSEATSQYRGRRGWRPSPPPAG